MEVQQNSKPSEPKGPLQPRQPSAPYSVTIVIAFKKKDETRIVSL